MFSQVCKAFIPHSNMCATFHVYIQMQDYEHLPEETVTHYPHCTPLFLCFPPTFECGYSDLLPSDMVWQCVLWTSYFHNQALDLFG